MMWEWKDSAKESRSQTSKPPQPCERAKAHRVIIEKKKRGGRPDPRSNTSPPAFVNITHKTGSPLRTPLFRVHAVLNAANGLPD